MLEKRSVFVYFLTALLGLSCLPELPVLAESSAGGLRSGRDSEASQYRLSKNVIPSRYELDFKPDPERGRFTGSELIDLSIKKACKSILINGNEIQVQSAKLISATNKEIKLSVKSEKALERLSFNSNSTIPPGIYRLQCNFSGIHNDQLAGFYRSTFKNKQGKTCYLAVTQMEPTDARRMFPCFDEPEFKAVFKVKVRIPVSHAAISNAPQLKESINAAGTEKTVEFEDSEPMSSYLLALLVGEFRATDLLESEGVKIRVWSVEHDPALGNYARDNAGKLLKFLNAYFRIPYPWKKLDLIAIPDFEAGAMENPGAITFREKYLLADEKKSSLSTRQDIVGILAHEMAHLWFGDLVTMKWWDDLWLNEAFATWMADKAVDAVYPEWHAITQFFSDRLRALYTDSLHSTRSIQSPVVKPADALQMFDEITYVKGAAVLRMLEAYLGEKTFQDGVSAYLKKHSFKNAATDDLWASLAELSKKPVKAIMDTWCKQPGYPLLSVNRNAKKLLLSQERFFLDGEKPGMQRWQIPLAVRQLSKAEEAKAYRLMNAKSESIQLDSNSDPFFANAGAFGFYRTFYDDKSRTEISANVAKLTAEERLSFLNDQAALALSGRSRIENLLSLLKLYKNENNFAVWHCIIDSLNQIDRFVDTGTRGAFAAYVRDVLGPEFQRLGFERKPSEDAPMNLVRSDIITALGTYGQDKAVIEKSRALFAAYQKDANSVNADLLDAITEVVAHNGGKAEFETFKQAWKKADNPESEHRNLFALTKFHQKELQDSALALTLSKEVRLQDAPKLLSAFFDDKQSKQAAWKFMSSHWAQIKASYAPHMLARLSEAPASLSTPDEYQEVKAFFAKIKVAEGESNIKRMLEKLKVNARFRQSSAPALNKALLLDKH
ncbi:MAG: M1 family metallopeptidase [Candidatus Obscuribacterales bacterium]|nr:M1 family metallopeptidase [Candidatus Obscuribacterales bacterium]